MKLNQTVTYGGYKYPRYKGKNLKIVAIKKENGNDIYILEPLNNKRNIQIEANILEIRPLKNKYGAKKVTVDGITFDSLAESRYYKYLKELQENGEIDSFNMQVPFELVPKYRRPITGETVRAIKYVADFEIFKGDETFIVDVKGKVLPEFIVKRKIFETKYNKPLYLAKYDYKARAFTIE